LEVILLLTGVGSFCTHGSAFVPGRTCPFKFLQEYWAGCNTTACRLSFKAVFLWCWWVHESATTARKGLGSTNFVLGGNTGIALLVVLQVLKLPYSDGN